MFNQHLATRVNNEPMIMLNCTATELRLLVRFSIAFWFVFALLVVGLILGLWLPAIAVMFLGAIVTIYIIAKWIGRTRDNKPDHFFYHLLEHRLHRLNIYSLPYVNRCGRWSRGRYL